MTTRTSIEDATAELLAVAPSEFVAARNARVKELRADGDRELADRVAKLRRPSVATWAVNAAARTTPDGVRELVDAVRALQQPGTTDVRDATQRLDDALDALVDAAAAALTDIDAKPTADRRAEVRTALRVAALADDPTALLEARLLDIDAADPDDTLAAALRAGANAAGRSRSTRKQATAKPPARPSIAKLRASLDEARDAHTAARNELRTAGRELRRIERELDSARRAVEQARASVDDAESLVEARQAELDDARSN